MRSDINPMWLCVLFCVLCESVGERDETDPSCQQTERDWLGERKKKQQKNERKFKKKNTEKSETQACSSMSHHRTTRINCLIYWNRPSLAINTNHLASRMSCRRHPFLFRTLKLQISILLQVSCASRCAVIYLGRIGWKSKGTFFGVFFQLFVLSLWVLQFVLTRWAPAADAVTHCG